jgi:hypothetical protein
MHIDCDKCQVRGLACGDCVVTILLGAPPEGVVLDADEQRALEVLAGCGLVPPLRLVRDRDDASPAEAREVSGLRAQIQPAERSGLPPRAITG